MGLKTQFDDDMSVFVVSVYSFDMNNIIYIEKKTKPQNRS